jgi:hypothetical protein
MQQLASLVLILSMLVFLVGNVLRITAWPALGTRISIAAWVALMVALPIAIPGLVSMDPVLMGVYAVGAIGTVLYVGLKLHERLRR